MVNKIYYVTTQYYLIGNRVNLSANILTFLIITNKKSNIHVQNIHFSLLIVFSSPLEAVLGGTVAYGWHLP